MARLTIKKLPNGEHWIPWFNNSGGVDNLTFNLSNWARYATQESGRNVSWHDFWTISQTKIEFGNPAGIGWTWEGKFNISGDTIQDGYVTAFEQINGGDYGHVRIDEVNIPVKGNYGMFWHLAAPLKINEALHLDRTTVGDSDPIINTLWSLRQGDEYRFTTIYDAPIPSNPSQSNYPEPAEVAQPTLAQETNETPTNAIPTEKTLGDKASSNTPLAKDTVTAKKAADAPAAKAAPATKKTSASPASKTSPTAKKAAVAPVKKATPTAKKTAAAPAKKTTPAPKKAPIVTKKKIGASAALKRIDPTTRKDAITGQRTDTWTVDMKDATTSAASGVINNGDQGLILFSGSRFFKDLDASNTITPGDLEVGTLKASFGASPASGTLQQNGIGSNDYSVFADPQKTQNLGELTFTTPI